MTTPAGRTACARHPLPFFVASSGELWTAACKKCATRWTSEDAELPAWVREHVEQVLGLTVDPNAPHNGQEGPA